MPSVSKLVPCKYQTLGPDTRIIRGHRLPISRYRDKLSATYRGTYRGLKNRRLFFYFLFFIFFFFFFKSSTFFTTSAFLSPSKSRKSQATKCRAFKTNRALNKHRISQNQLLLIHYHLAPSGLATRGSIIAKFTRVKIRLCGMVI